MRETNTHPSLLPYLLPGPGNFCLRLQASDSQQSSSASSNVPFSLLNDSDPLSHTFRAAFVTDFGSTIKEVNLLIQRDVPVWPAGSKTTLSNTTIDNFWQQAIATRRARNPEHSMLLASQVGKQQQLLAFASLFYCKKQHIYFEITCPHCGKTLQLCKDDSMLTAAGLNPYSTSLRRNLFCPSCFQDNKQTFYTLEKDVEDPSTVLDCRQLMLEFGKLTSAMEPLSRFPCLSCQQHNSCYGEQHAVYDALFPFSFYPFFMLITERDSLEGFHLLTLLHEDSPTRLSMESPSQSTSASTSDKAIHGIIETIAGNWQQEATQETVSGHTYPPSKKDSSPTANVLPDKQPVTPATNASFSTNSPTGHDNTDDDLSQETIIIKSPVMPPHEPSDTLHTDTVLLTPNPARNVQRHATPSTEKKMTTDDIDLAATVILRPGEKL